MATKEQMNNEDYDEDEGNIYERKQQKESLETKLGRVEERVNSIKTELHDVKKTLDKYVTKIEFWPVKIIVFGLAGLILSSVFAAIIALTLGGRH